jgi:pyrrolidone-carboxylate peptidase
MVRILLTGFGAWDVLQYNPTSGVARALDGMALSGARYGSPIDGRVEGRVLDVAWSSGTATDGTNVESATKVLAREVAVLKPTILLSMGVTAASSHQYDVEVGAGDYAAGKDVAGKEPKTPRLHTKWPSVLMSPFPARQIIEAMKKAGFAATSKVGLGNFLCERVAYEGARLARLKHSSLMRAGFIHLPNPLVRAGVGFAARVEELDAEQRAVFDQAEREVVAAMRIALEVCLGSLPADFETRPQAWKYLDEWTPELEIDLMR